MKNITEHSKRAQTTQQNTFWYAFFKAVIIVFGKFNTVILSLWGSKALIVKNEHTLREIECVMSKLSSFIETSPTCST